MIYSIHLSGEVVEGDKFSVGLTKKCSVKPLANHVSNWSQTASLSLS